jgi:hypothetical protein
MEEDWSTLMIRGIRVIDTYRKPMGFRALDSKCQTYAKRRREDKRSVFLYTDPRSLAMRAASIQGSAGSYGKSIAMDGRLSPSFKNLAAGTNSAGR